MALAYPAFSTSTVDAITTKLAQSVSDAVMHEGNRALHSVGGAAKRFRNRKNKYPSKRGYKKKSSHLKSIGEAPGSSTCKVREVSKVDFLYDGRTLNSLDILSLPHTTGDGDNRNERQRQVANIRGWKVCCSVDNQRIVPLYFNMALIITKNGIFGVNDFFRGRDGERSVNFSTGLTSNELHCLPINTDKYHVLWHHRALLNGSSATSNVNRSGTTYGIINKYIKLGRQVRFENADTATSANEDARLVFWSDDFGASSTTLTQADAFQLQLSVCCYFRDPGCC